jgi:TatD DNase family protein
MLIDTHAHLYADEFKQDLSSVIERSLVANVQKIILPCIDHLSVEPMLHLSTTYPHMFYPCIGLHPCYVKEDTYEFELYQVEEQLKSTHRFYAIGEIGIDLYWDKSTLELQKRAFIQQIAWAKKHQLPIIIHARESLPELFRVLDEYNDSSLSGVFHCFSGTIEDAKIIASYQNFKLGIGGVITYKNSTLPSVLEHIDISALILETDAPYLPPVPYRGKRNEPSYIPYIVKALEEVYQKDSEEIASITTQNALNLFKITA